MLVKDKYAYQVDFGVKQNHSTSIISSSELDIEVLDKYTIISTTSNSIQYFYINDYATGTGASMDWSAPFTLIFNLINYEGDCRLYIGDNDYSNVYSKLLSDLEIIPHSKVKLTYDGAEIIIFNNDVEIDRVTKSYDNFRIGFQLRYDSLLSYNLLTICKR